MNIIYVHRTRGTGAEGVHISGIIKGFRQLGHNVVVVAPPGVDAEQSAGDNPFQEPSGLLSQILKFAARKAPQFLFELMEIAYNVRAYAQIGRHLKRSKVDLIYERHSFFSKAASNLAVKYKIPYVVEVNEIAGEKRVRKQFFVGLAKKMERGIFEKANGIIVVSEYLKNKIAEQGVAKNKILVLPNAVDPASFKADPKSKLLRHNYDIADSVVVIGFIGWFVAWHNIERLIEVFAELSADRNVRLTLIGDGVLKAKLQQTVVDLKVNDKVIFPGAVKYNEIPAWIGMMDICVIPDSNDYRSPIKLFEYMVCSKAVVAPRIQPIESVVTDRENGVLFNKGDRSDLKEKLLKLIDDKALREKLGKAAREKILNDHVWVKNAEKTLEVLK